MLCTCRKGNRFKFYYNLLSDPHSGAEGAVMHDKDG